MTEAHFAVRMLAVFGVSFSLFGQSKPVQIGEIRDVGAPDTPVAYSIGVSERYAYIGTTLGVYVYDVLDPARPVPVGHENPPFTGPAPQKILIVGNHAYLAHLGLRILDISDPSHPVTTAFIDQGNAGTNGLAMDVAVAGKYAYLANGADGLRIYDVSKSNSITNLGHWPNPNGAYGNYPMGIAVFGNYAYLAAFNDGLLVFNVADPTNPVLTDSKPDTLAIRVAVSGNRLFLLSDKLVIFDLSDPAHPAKVGEAKDLPSPAGLFVSGNYAYVANTGFTVFGPYMYDVSEPANIVRISPKSDAYNTYTVWDMAVGGDVACLVLNHSINLYALGTPANPTLTLSSLGNRNYVLSWPAPSLGFQLQQTEDLGSGNWVTVSNAVVSTSGGTNRVSVLGGKANGFFRLVR